VKCGTAHYFLALNPLDFENMDGKSVKRIQAKTRIYNLA
jgi:hypothetical protein